ncbi:MAG: Cna B-type domain-containing protein, partial [Candidatus Ventricola sp.]|nr:Cna B-type domain-containing protein [Candidatus Ventricola sp.]
MQKNGRFMRRRKGRLPALAVLLLALLCAAPSALAIDPIETGREASLTVEYGMKGMTFTIYRVAEMTGFGEFTPSAGFDDIVSADELTDLDSAGWSALAGTLSGYVNREGQWRRSQRIGADGKATFSGLRVGLYLVLGTPYETDGKVVQVQPSLVALPSRNAKDVWMYGVTVEPKPEVVERYDEIQVRKVWSDGGSASRPKEITVRLYVNGKFYGAATLNAANN